MTRKRAAISDTSILDQMEALKISEAFFSMQARIQIVQSIIGEKTISYDRLCRLYKEVNNGESPKKGMFPSNTDLFLTWGGNVSSMLFLQAHQSYLDAGLQQGWAMYYALFDYLRHPFIVESNESASTHVTRSWTLLRFIDSEILAVYECSDCGLPHLKERNMPDNLAVCFMHDIPPRVKGRRKQEEGDDENK